MANTAVLRSTTRGWMCNPYVVHYELVKLLYFKTASHILHFASLSFLNLKYVWAGKILNQHYIASIENNPVNSFQLFEINLIESTNFLTTIKN